MKINKCSLKKKWFLLSLSLLAPGILAAEDLVFNYRVSDSLDPRDGLQVRACHSKTDPMEIKFKFDKITLSTIHTMEVTVEGESINKSYAALRSSVQPLVSTAADTDRDFQIPFTVKVDGALKGWIDYHKQDKVNNFNYSGEFCFDTMRYSGLNGIGSLHGLNVAFADNTVFYGTTVELHTKDDFDRFCKNKNRNPGEKYYWEDGPLNVYASIPSGTEMSRYYSSLTGEEQKKFLTSNIFYARKKNLGITYLVGGLVSKDFNRPINENVDGDINNPRVHKYIFTDFSALRQDLLNSSACYSAGAYYCGNTPLAPDERVRIENGVYTLKLGNRNISSLKIVITGQNGKVLDERAWKTDPKDPVKNILHLQPITTPYILKPAVVSDDDPYRNFYTEGAGGYFKGTLVSKLNNNYKKFIKEMPLSQPAESDGDINVINTDSLTFLITGKTASATEYSGPSISIYGQPLKFAPMKINRSQLSATQVRNACN